MTDFATTLKPRTLESQAIPGWGDHRIAVAGCEIAFSYEDPGFHVIFDGKIALEVADRIVAEIYENIKARTGQKGIVVPL